MVKITYTPADMTKLEQMLRENGQYLITVHNRHIVRHEKITPVPAEVPPTAGPPPAPKQSKSMKP